MTDTLFYNVWRTETPENQKRLVATMREEAPKLAANPGFRSLAVLEGADGRVLVEGRWASREAFDAAVIDDDGAQASRQGLEAFGTAEPGVFTESFRIGSLEAPSGDYPSTAFWDRFARREVAANGPNSSASWRAAVASRFSWSTACWRPGRSGAASCSAWPTATG